MSKFPVPKNPRIKMVWVRIQRHVGRSRRRYSKIKKVGLAAILAYCNRALYGVMRGSTKLLPADGRWALLPTRGLTM